MYTKDPVTEGLDQRWLFKFKYGALNLKEVPHFNQLSELDEHLGSRNTRWIAVSVKCDHSTIAKHDEYIGFW